MHYTVICDDDDDDLKYETCSSFAISNYYYLSTQFDFIMFFDYAASVSYDDYVLSGWWCGPASDGRLCV